jgi:N-acetyl-gamma-glutamyl-phosphate reductase
MTPSHLSTVAVFLHGARGMLAGELLRLAELHPGLELAAASSREPGALPHRHLAGPAAACDAAEFERRLEQSLARGERCALVLALPHGEAERAWLALRARLGARAEALFVLDLSADFRLRDPHLRRATYGHAYTDAAEAARFVYGLPELGREALRGARRVAAPGCFATALQLAVVPAAEAHVLDPSRAWVLNGVTGSSGSGNEPKPGTHHPHRHGNLWAYSVGGHRHEAELAQALAPFGPLPELAFVAHSGPFARGIHLGAVLPLARPLDSAEARALYLERYRGEPFVEVLGGAAGPDTPDLRSVSGSNRASLGVAVRGSVLHVLVTLDNLVKGGAGQGLQCLNLMLGFAETTGLPRVGLGVA